MSKTKSEVNSEVTPKVHNFYSILNKNGGYQLVRMTVDLAAGKILSVIEVGPEDVFVLASTSLSKQIRQDLGI